jgi:hypothetical protein
MEVSDPRRRDILKIMCHMLNLKISGVDFVTSLIVLDSKGIDVTFGKRIG